MQSLEFVATRHARRLDRWLADQEAPVSRSRWQELIRAGQVLINGGPAGLRSPVRPGDRITATLPDPVPPARVAPEPIPVNVVYEDEDCLVLDKPPGLVVHPAPGHPVGTLVSALLHHCGDLPGIGGEARPGIVHRLDKETSGLMVVAKTQAALDALARAFQERRTTKAYAALCAGAPRFPSGTIDAAIGRHPHHRKKMMAHAPRGRAARSHYVAEERFGDAFARFAVEIETGRTHQIRVHLAFIGCPVLGDDLYGGRRAQTPIPEYGPAPRHFLHAARLGFPHPRTGEPVEFTADLPPDMAAALAALREAFPAAAAD